MRPPYQTATRSTATPLAKICPVSTVVWHSRLGCVGLKRGSSRVTGRRVLSGAFGGDL